MFTRACLAFATLAFLVATSIAHASGIGPGPYSPITYDFSGVLNQSVGGSASFSGTFTINGAEPQGPGPGTIAIGATPLGSTSATLNVGGQAFAFENPIPPVPGSVPGSWYPPVANPLILFTFNALSASDPSYRYTLVHSDYTQAGLPVPIGGAQGFLLTTNQAGPSVSGQSASMTINLLNSAGSIWPLSSNATRYPLLSLPDFNINQLNLQITQASGTTVSATGYLTRLEPESTIPEPSTIAIFSLLLACSLIYGQTRRPYGSRACENAPRES